MGDDVTVLCSYWLIVTSDLASQFESLRDETTSSADKYSAADSIRQSASAQSHSDGKANGSARISAFTPSISKQAAEIIHKLNSCSNSSTNAHEYLRTKLA
jgi:hypothetical protein